MCKLSTLDTIIVTAVLGAMLFLCICLAGCGQEAVPGGTNYAAYEAVKPDGTTVKVIFKGNKDSNLTGLKFSPVTGELVIQKLEANGSNLGNMQMQWSIVESQNRAMVLGQLIGAIKELVPLMAGGGGIAIPSAGGTGTSALDTPAQMELRNALLAKIANCPFMSADQKASLTASVKAAPAAYLSYLAPIVAQATTDQKVTP